MALRRGVVIGTIATLLVGACGAGVAYYVMPRARPPKAHPESSAPHPHADVEESDDESDKPIDDVTVKTIHPKRDKNFTVTFRQLCFVRAYFEVALRARASGVIKYIPKDVGARVTQGELLVEIDVPDLRQEVAQKDAVVDQRRQELQVAKAQLKTAAAFVEVAQAEADVAQAQVAAALATRDFREIRYHRFQQMLADKGVTPQIVEEEKRDFDAAQAMGQAAQATVKKAGADLHEKEASLDAARADITLNEALVRVAERDRDRSQALADYARLTAPFDGVIVEREGDLGTFVQNATTAAAKPLLTLERTDIVTVVTKLPDNVAPFVTRDTRVLLQLDQLPGVQLEGRVTRFTPSFLNADRTMQVEVDLFNRGATRYGEFLGQYFGCQLAAAGGANPLETAVLAGAGHYQLGPKLRSVSDPLPIPPLLRGGVPEPPRLLPGMSGQMTVLLQRFANAYLLPSSAIFPRGGTQFIEVVKDGKIELFPVRVQVNDGRLAKVTVVARPANDRTGESDLLRELTGDEEVVASRQSEFSEGQSVHAVVVDW
jgi:multidrug efflux pump subunit AcrA (membrane-fusion protein)